MLWLMTRAPANVSLKLQSSSVLGSGLSNTCPGLKGLVDAFLDTRAAGLLHIDAPAAVTSTVGDGGGAEGDEASATGGPRSISGPTKD